MLYIKEWQGFFQESRIILSMLFELLGSFLSPIDGFCSGTRGGFCKDSCMQRFQWKPPSIQLGAEIQVPQSLRICKYKYGNCRKCWCKAEI